MQDKEKKIKSKAAAAALTTKNYNNENEDIFSSLLCYLLTTREHNVKKKQTLLQHKILQPLMFLHSQSQKNSFLHRLHA